MHLHRVASTLLSILLLLLCCSPSLLTHGSINYHASPTPSLSSLRGSGRRLSLSHQRAHMHTQAQGQGQGQGESRQYVPYVPPSISPTSTLYIASPFFNLTDFSPLFNMTFAHHYPTRKFNSSSERNLRLIQRRRRARRRARREARGNNGGASGGGNKGSNNGNKNSTNNNNKPKSAVHESSRFHTDAYTPSSSAEHTPHTMADGDTATPTCDFFTSFHSYTAQDWYRWDSFLPGYTSASHSGGGASNTYTQLFQHHLITQNIQAMYAYDEWADENYDFLSALTNNNYFAASDIMLNMSVSLSRAYNLYRCNMVHNLSTQYTTERSTMTPLQYEAFILNKFGEMNIDFLTLDGVDDAVDWLSAYINKVLDIQSLTHTQDTTGAAWGTNTYDTFGLFRNAWWYNVGYFQRNHLFFSPAFFQIVAHYLHLLPTSLINTLRQHVSASLTALYRLYLDAIPGEHSTAQWLIMVCGVQNHAYILLWAQYHLSIRGVSDGEQLYTYTPDGKWRVDDAITLAEELITAFWNRLNNYGMTEYLSDYYTADLHEVEFSIQHAASQVIYTALTNVRQWLFKDMTNNFLPAAGTFSGPSARTYDLFDGAHSGLDRYDIPQYFRHVYQPYCSYNFQRPSLLNESEIFTVSGSLCDAAAPIMREQSADTQFYITRVAFAAWQVAGLDWSPYQTIREGRDYPLRAVTTRSSEVGGQTRFNFLTKDYQIGFSGDDKYGEPMSIVVAARLAGAPVVGAPLAQVSGGTTRSLGYVRVLFDTTDTPFHLAYNNVPGESMDTAGRVACVQYQGYMLLTALLAAKYESDSSIRTAPFNTDITAPLAAEGIYANGVKLPIAVDTYYAIPPDAILSVRHGNATISIRILLFETSPNSNILNATSVHPVDTNIYPLASLRAGQGVQPYTLMWQVDEESARAGAGRFTIHHKHRGEDSYQYYRVALVMAASHTYTDEQFTAFNDFLRAATYESTTTNDNWHRFNQPWNTQPAPYPWYNSENIGSSAWTSTLMFGAHRLQLQRTDTYNPFPFYPTYNQPVSGPFNIPPYWMSFLVRKVDGEVVMDQMEAGTNSQVQVQLPQWLYTPHIHYAN